jgi:hypothetical protein
MIDVKFSSFNSGLFMEKYLGTLVASSATVSVGQSDKVFYGKIIARDVTIHQDSKFWYVPFAGGL